MHSQSHLEESRAERGSGKLNMTSRMDLFMRGEGESERGRQRVMAEMAVLCGDEKLGKESPVSWRSFM